MITRWNEHRFMKPNGIGQWIPGDKDEYSATNKLIQ